MTLRYPIRILSDLHFRMRGGRLHTADDVRPLFRGAATVILNGDTVEQLTRGLRQTEKDMGVLRDVAREEGCELVLLRGNHDPENGLPSFSFSHRGQVLRIEHGDFGVLQLKPIDGTVWERPFSFFWYFLKTLRTYPVYWRQIRLGFERIAENEILVLGHTHFPSFQQKEGRTVINLGAHVRGFESGRIDLQGPDDQIVFQTKGQRHVIQGSEAENGP